MSGARKPVSPLKTVERRIILTIIFFAALLIVLGGRITWLQAVEAPKLKKKAIDQRLRKIDLVPARGRIYDRNGEELATSVPVKAVYATPYLVRKPRATALKLAGYLSADAAVVHEKLTRKTGFVYIARQVPLEKAEKIKAAKLRGVGLLDESKRIYPGGTLAAHTIGFTDIDGKGIAGLERHYQRTLGGKTGLLVAEHDPRGRVIPGGFLVQHNPVPGKSIQLTLDRDIQYRVERAVAKAYRGRKARSVSAIVMKVKTGDILAVATAPTFNPNIPKTRKQKLIRNRALSDLYEPGSTFKTVIVSGALDDGTVRPGDKIYCPPSVRVADRVVGEAHGRGGRTFTVSQIVSESSNVGAVKVGLKMGKYPIYDWVTRFGFTRSTGIDFPGEGVGYLPKPKNWSPSTIGNVPIGQGVAISPLQLMRAVAAIGNDGMMVTPHLAHSVAGRRFQGPAPRRVLSERASAQMMKMLERVVKDGTGTAAAIRGYRVAGKTGTAQKAIPGRGYVDGKYVGSFVGVAPASDPELAVIVVIDEPKAGYYGGVVAAPVFSEIGEFALRKLRIAPDALSKPASTAKKKKKKT